jgi:hypothetical protein
VCDQCATADLAASLTAAFDDPEERGRLADQAPPATAAVTCGVASLAAIEINAGNDDDNGDHDGDADVRNP